MSTEQNLEYAFEGIDLIPSVSPEIMRSKMNEFVDRCVKVITSAVDNNEKLDLIFPLNGSVMFMYLIQKELPEYYRDRVNWVAAYRPDQENKSDYAFAYTKGRFVGKPVIIDDMWDSGESTEHISNAVAPEYSDEVQVEFDSFNDFTPSNGAIAIPVLVATTKEGKLCESAVYTYPLRNGRAPWIASGFGLDCGKASKRTSRYERLGGVSYAVTDLDSYTHMVSVEESRNAYEQILEASGRMCYGEDYDNIFRLLELMDNEEIDLKSRADQLMLALRLIKEV